MAEGGPIIDYKSLTREIRNKQEELFHQLEDRIAGRVNGKKEKFSLNGTEDFDSKNYYLRKTFKKSDP